jgi:hemoglobin
MPSETAPTTATERRSEFADTVTRETGIDEAMIERLVTSFYVDVRADPVLAPIFEAIVEDWTPHLAQMRAFWSSVTLMTGRYHGRPMEKHLPLPVDAAHFDRWLALFEGAARRETPPAAAELFIERAHRIAESLQLGIASSRGQLLAPGERLQPVTASV